MELAVAVVSNRDHCPDFSKCLAALIARLASQPLFNGVTLKMHQNVSLLSVGRQDIIDQCREEKFSHVLMLDDDMVFPPSICHELMAHKKRAIGVNSMRKNIDVLWPTAKGLDGKWLHSKGKTGIEEVESVGLALFLLELDVLRKVPKPHFPVMWNEEKETYTGEDHHFIRKIRAAGEKVYVDHGLANRCGHVGKIIYTYDLYDKLKDSKTIDDILDMDRQTEAQQG